MALLLVLLQIIPPWWCIALFISTIVIDWGLQEVFGVMSNNFRRLVTGILGSLGVGLIWWQLLFLLVETIGFGQ